MKRRKHVARNSQITKPSLRAGWLLVYATVGAVALGLSLHFLVGLGGDGGSDVGQARMPRAAIVDQLSTTHGNQTFVEECSAALSEAGFAVDYYDGDSVTVDLYRDLPTYGYEVLVLRVHSATYHPDLRVVALFTSQPYSAGKYLNEQLGNQVRAVAFAPYEEGDPTYFGVTDRFIRSGIGGRFDNTVVIMMGCDGMRYECMAEAFVAGGATVYLGWDDFVSTVHADKVTVDLLQRLLQGSDTVGQAVKETMALHGADPYYDGVLSYYPPDSGNSTLGQLLNR